MILFDWIFSDSKHLQGRYQTWRRSGKYQREGILRSNSVPVEFRSQTIDLEGFLRSLGGLSLKIIGLKIAFFQNKTTFFIQIGKRPDNFQSRQHFTCKTNGVTSKSCDLRSTVENAFSAVRIQRSSKLCATLFYTLRQ